jgi:phenylacetate-CoA ligase
MSTARARPEEDRRTRFYDEAAERPSWEEALKENEELLRNQVRYVYDHSLFYREKLDSAGLGPESVKTARDFERLPFTTKEQLRESQRSAPPFGRHQACPSDAICRIYSTSGTTGVPTFIGLTRHDLDLWMRTAARALWARGMRPFHRVVSPLGAGPFVGGFTNEVISHFGACLIPLGPGHTNRVVTSCQFAGATVILASPSYAMHLLEHCKAHDIDPRSLKLERLLVAGEPGGGVPETRRRIEGAFGCHVLESMGNGDSGLAIWSECEEKNGMHFMGQGMVYPEIIDSKTGRTLPVQQGTEGELVYTTVNRECIPVLRFRTNDHVVVLGTDCACGRRTMRIRCIGRYDDLLIIRAVNVYPSAIQDVIHSCAPRTTGRFEILLPAPGPQVEPPVHIRVEIAQGSPDELKSTLERVFMEKLVFRSRVEIVSAGAIKSSEYKGRVVRVVPPGQT